MELLEQLQSALGETYAIERELGGGGMSRVFLATDRALARRVVIKVLAPELAAEVSTKRFEREIRLAASLQQANIVPVLTAGSTDGVAHYTMPFVDGLSLRDRLKQDGPPSLAETIGILRDVARALAYAHERGVVHRDIKPENVLLSGGAAVVTDFGIAKAISAARVDGTGERGTSTTVTRAGMAVGTPAYMSPEQITADPAIDHRTDLYSFGCLAYELLSGKPPFAGREAHQLIGAHLSEEPGPLGEQCPECPTGLVRLVTRCLAKDPERRPASAREILDAIDGVAVRTTAFTRIRNRLTSRQRAGAMVVVLLLVAGASAVLVRDRLGAASAAAEASVGVLPFVNRGDTARDVWADGLTDEITTALARRGDLRLATRTSVERYRGQSSVDVPAAGHALQVGYLLHGTLLPEGNLVRVTAWLSRTEDGVDVWQNQFDLGTEDILGTLDSLTSALTAAVRVNMLGRMAPVFAEAPGSLRGTSDTAAYQLYLRGQVLLRGRGNGVRRAAELFQQAIARDPGFARAHSALSAALVILPNFADTTNAELAGPVTAAARRALELDPTLAQAEASLALVAMHEYRWAEADSEFRRALDLDPNDAYTHMHYGRMLTYVGRLEEAAREMERAESLDPTSPVIGGWLALNLLLGGRRDEAFSAMDRALELDSMTVPVAYMGSQVALARGQRARARALAGITWRPNGIARPAPWPAAAAATYAALGDTATVDFIARYVDTAAPSRAYGHSSKGTLALAEGDTARALDEFERATDAGEFWPSAPFAANPIFDPVRTNARFAALLRRVNLDVDLFTSPHGGRPH